VHSLVKDLMTTQVVTAGPPPDLKPGQQATLDAGTVSKAMTGECSIPGHKEAGMTFELRVSGAVPAAAAAADHADASLDDSAKLDPNATPPAAWQAYDPKLAPAAFGREHKLTLTATEGVVEVAPGVKQQAWELRRQGPRTGPARQGRRPVHPHPDQRPQEQARPLDRLPRLQGGLERRDAHHQPR